ncbi:MAG: hypothetical protein VKI63_06140 [Cyanobium sp.]|nr:hypothetical protein [Cyanobium sp.]
MDQAEAATAVARCDAALSAGVTADPGRQAAASNAAIAYRNGFKQGVDDVMSSRGYADPTPGSIARAQLQQKYGGDPAAALQAVMAPTG